LAASPSEDREPGFEFVATLAWANDH